MGKLSSSEIEVKTVWSEMVKPYIPTPSHLTNNIVKLSVLDQLALPSHVPTLLFYSPPSSSNEFVITNMKTSLSKALSEFYPLAGRLIDDSTLIYDDHGALLIHTRVSSALKHYQSLIVSSFSGSDHDSHLKPQLRNLFPLSHLLHGSHKEVPVPISAFVQMAFQVNVFECGGVVIGCLMSHKLMDGISAGSFLKYWAGLCLGLGPGQLVKPNFNAILSTFPPCHLPDPPADMREGWLEEEPLEGSTIMKVKPFVFDPASITAIKEKAVSVRIPNPTRIESVIAFLWKHCLDAGAFRTESVGPTDLILTADMRRRACPPLPMESMGNLATNVGARVEKNGLRITDMVAEIRKAIHEFNDGKVVGFQGEKGGEAFWEYRDKITAQGSTGNKSTYVISSQCGSGFADVDFGFGKPTWMYPFVGIIPTKNMGFVVLVDHIDPTLDPTQKRGNGIEAWVMLNKKQMHNLETNPKFLDFASPLCFI